MKYLFLDDIRYPPEVGNYFSPVEFRVMYRKEEWEIVRNYDEFVKKILDEGLPLVVSFDHDLADIKPIEGSNLVIASDWNNEKTGYDCAKWLLEYCIQEEKPLPDIFVHSMNPVGKDNILNLFKKWKN